MIEVQEKLWFSVPIWYCKLDFNTEALKKKVLETEKETDTENRSNVGGWQSHKKAYRYEFLNEVTNKITSVVKECIKSYTNKYLEVEINNSWLNVNRAGNYNTKHSHPGSYFSACYYISNPDPSSVIRFSRNDIDLVDAYESEYDLGVQNTTATYNAKPNTLLVFPSWLCHEVLPNNYEDPRISYAINYGISK